ncbi:MAG: hypothetical protein M3Y57_22220 [Acidobacteriota bacterium]|nr:hypothetical protein [Acidobacteriota bacterium]
MSQKIPSPKARDIALRLLAYEAAAPDSPRENTREVVRVVETLRRALSALTGPIAFRALLARALTLAKPHAPSLGAVQITPDGALDRLGEIHKDTAEEGGVVLIAQLIALLVAFIGEGLTLHLLTDLWPGLSGSVTELHKESESI